MNRSLKLLVATVLVSASSGVMHAAEVDVAAQVASIKKAGARSAGQQQAAAAWKQLSTADAAQLPEILAGMDGASVLATNWLRAAADAVAQRAAAKDQPLPIAALKAFLAADNHAPRARSTAYELILRDDPATARALTPTFLNDTSLELRRKAVSLKMQAASQEENKTRAAQAYRTALSSARDIDQIEDIDQALTKLGVKVDLPAHFGFITSWNLIASFDNTGKAGFDVGYPPEKKIDLTAVYDGKNGQAKWLTHQTSDKYGMVDLNKVIGNVKGAVAYAYCEFIAAENRPCELRLGCINANKVWLNGRLITANEVYHANTSIDQYTGAARLKKGKNTILVKICQNEQEENWAQRWQFQLRVCDKYGAAILSQDRKLKQTAAVR